MSRQDHCLFPLSPSTSLTYFPFLLYLPQFNKFQWRSSHTPPKPVNNENNDVWDFIYFHRYRYGPQRVTSMEKEASPTFSVMFTIPPLNQFDFTGKQWGAQRGEGGCPSDSAGKRNLGWTSGQWRSWPLSTFLLRVGSSVPLHWAHLGALFETETLVPSRTWLNQNLHSNKILENHVVPRYNTFTVWETLLHTSPASLSTNNFRACLPPPTGAVVSAFLPKPAAASGWPVTSVSLRVQFNISPAKAVRRLHSTAMLRRYAHLAVWRSEVDVNVFR